MDPFGINHEAIIKSLIPQVEGMVPLLDPELVSEYLEAMKLAPGLVKRESQISAFLRAEKLHTVHAAKRLAFYWKSRKHFFGDRWLLEMNQTGGELRKTAMEPYFYLWHLSDSECKTLLAAGTLTSDQVELLRMGFQAQTSSPQSVIIVDRSRIPKDVNVETVQPILFYLQHVYASCEEAVTNGTIVFHVINSGRLPLLHFTPKSLKRLVDSSAFIMKNNLIARSFDAGQEHMLDFLAFQQERLSEKHFGRAKFVIGDSVRSTVNMLEENGLDRACIPLALGGDYFYYTHFNDWIRERLSVEGSMLAAPPVRNACAANAAAYRAEQEKTKAQANDDRDTITTSTLTTTRNSSLGSNNMLVERKAGEPWRDFVKRRYHVYGQRSYQKKRREVDELKERRHSLKLANAHQQIENRRLGSLLAEAKTVVAAHLESTSAADAQAEWP